MAERDNPKEDTILLTENFEAWVSYEEDDEPIYHLDTGRATLHFFHEEWEELRELFRELDKQSKKK
ncbi:MAG: hypothetical protein ACOYL5_07725 [Phototrophicaceae bacterium]|jgi:hypothetical protein